MVPKVSENGNGNARASTILRTSLSIHFLTRHWTTPTSVIRTLDTRAFRLHLYTLMIPFVTFLQRQPGCLPTFFLALRLHLAILAFSTRTKELIKWISAWETLNLTIPMT